MLPVCYQSLSLFSHALWQYRPQLFYTQHLSLLKICKTLLVYLVCVLCA